MDYYRGKVKSIYEKEASFKDFYRNIPLSESNFYDNHNLTRIKYRFNNLVQSKMGRDQMNSRYDPYTPSGVSKICEKCTNRLYLNNNLSCVLLWKINFLGYCPKVFNSCTIGKHITCRSRKVP